MEDRSGPWSQADCVLLLPSKVSTWTQHITLHHGRSFLQIITLERVYFEFEFRIVWIGSLSLPKWSQSEWLYQEWWMINPEVKFIITQRLQSDHYRSDNIQTAVSIFRNVINNQIELEVVKTDFLRIRIGFPYFVFFLSTRSKFHWHLICEHKIPFKTFMSQ